MSDVTILAPSPTLTVTVEEHGGEPDIHVHAGGQGAVEGGVDVLKGLDPVSHVPLGFATR